MPLTVLMFVADTSVACLAFSAAARSSLSIGSPLMVANDPPADADGIRSAPLAFGFWMPTRLLPSKINFVCGVISCRS